MIKLKTLIEHPDDESTFDQKINSKNKWIELLRKGDKEEIKHNLYVLVHNSYGSMGGHVRVKDPSSVLDPELTYWEAVDIDVDPDADAVLFGKKTPYGIKIGGMGHDGEKYSKSELVKKTIKQLNKSGYWMEAGDDFAKKLVASNTVPYLAEKEKVEKIFGQEIEWLNDKGWYERVVNDRGDKSKEIIVGKPNI